MNLSVSEDGDVDLRRPCRANRRRRFASAVAPVVSTSSTSRTRRPSHRRTGSSAADTPRPHSASVPQLSQPFASASDRTRRTVFARDQRQPQRSSANSTGHRLGLVVPTRLICRRRQCSGTGIDHLRAVLWPAVAPAASLGAKIDDREQLRKCVPRPGCLDPQHRLPKLAVVHPEPGDGVRNRTTAHPDNVGSRTEVSVCGPTVLEHRGQVRNAGRCVTRGHARQVEQSTLRSRVTVILAGRTARQASAATPSRWRRTTPGEREGVHGMLPDQPVEGAAAGGQFVHPASTPPDLRPAAGPCAASAGRR